MALSLTMMGAAAAQMVSFRIEDPLPAELRGRVADLMRSERPQDAEAALAAARIRDDLAWRKSGILLLRIETGCHADLCMVMIGRVTDQAIIPQLTLRAGPKVTVSDEAVKVWEVVSTKLSFEGGGNTRVDVWSRGDRWVADACGDCFRTPETRSQPDFLRPPASSAEQTFEEFRRALEPRP